VKFAPLLAPTEQVALEDMAWPMIGSPKYDGYRALTMPKLGGVSRNLKPFPNRALDAWLGSLPPFLDGEIVAGSPTQRGCFQRTSSQATTEDAGLKGLRFFVFDWFGDLRKPFHGRVTWLRSLRLPLGVELVRHRLLRNPAEAKAYEDKCLEAGFEGAMLRSPDGVYKCGRATVKEGIIYKRKVTLSGEAVITGVFSRQMNTNAQERDELGRAKRSKRKEGMVALKEVGGFQCKDVKTGVEFECAPGVLTQAQRRELYGRKLVGLVINYRADPSTKDKPRFARFYGFRSKIDY
jgi:DNA ligase 1